MKVLGGRSAIWKQAESCIRCWLAKKEPHLWG
jgi:hypothetical protein